MNSAFRVRHVRLGLHAISTAAVAVIAMGTAFAEEGALTLQSKTFVNGGMLPLSMINNIPDSGGMNTCAAGGAAGGNQSPQLSWTHVPVGTRSFAVIVYDVTAQFTHWAMYNIPASTTSLPENAGIAGSGFGTQNGNDFFSPSYGGPCPPTTLRPHAHVYVITLYALDEDLNTVKVFGDFVPAGPEGLYHELLNAARGGHVLASASISGHYSAVAPVH
jgi:Raf kinase inhibitor-like YbhB/YbcL family protein